MPTWGAFGPGLGVENCNSNDDIIINNQNDRQSATSSHQNSSQQHNRQLTESTERHDDHYLNRCTVCYCLCKLLLVTCTPPFSSAF
ncbi:hypothetical protein O181_007896 [Austropuccinia psidii MF-1]|uniref:Uncharacterized protein n=1 Tax=Austropuccinia psidii MF-1 TaxID=1389203 RepID=A0A9Q3BLN8_9BASI|nr:hypothetical protein [Austropuccinia psidii MF-1]